MSKKLALKDTNCALIGSSEDLKLRVASAKLEKEWDDAGIKEGLQIWRIEKFNVKDWPLDQYGEFFAGDCYIVLDTKKKGNAFVWNVYFWLGKECTQDEKGTAAYKTVELDDRLGCAPIQHREVQGYESKEFMHLFQNNITILKGGIASGFHHVGPKEYKPRLLQCKGKKRVQVTEVDLTADSLNKGDAFILDAGLDIYVWLPKKARGNEKYVCNQTANKIKNKRKGAKRIELQEAGNDKFWEILGGKPDKIKGKNEAPLDEVFDKVESTYKKKLFQLSDESGKIKFTKVAEGKLKKDMLKSEDVFILDAGSSCLCWIGNGSSKEEKNKAVLYATDYLGWAKRPVYIPITRIQEGRETSRFWKLFGK